MKYQGQSKIDSNKLVLSVEKEKEIREYVLALVPSDTEELNTSDIVFDLDEIKFVFRLSEITLKKKGE